jgi:hypothetical protein
MAAFWRVSRRRRPIVIGLPLAALGLLAAVALAEGAVRWLAPQPPAMIRDSERGRPTERSYRWTSPDGEFDNEVQLNRDLFHDVDHPPGPRPGVQRVLVLGDSFAEVAQFPIDRAWWHIAGDVLAKQSGTPVEAINLGVGGAGTAKEWELLQRYGLQYHPTAAVLAFCLENDVFNNSAELEDKVHKRPFYRLVDGRLTLMPEADLDGLNHRAWLPLWRTSHLYRLIARRWYITREAERQMLAGGGFPLYRQVYLRTPPPAWDEAWNITRELLRAVKQSLAAQGASLLVVFVPAKEQVYPEDWEQALAANPAMRAMPWDLTGPNRRAEAICRELSIPHLDLTPLLTQKSRELGRLYFRHDLHWNEAGNRVVGEAVGAFLAAMTPSQKDGAQ